MTQASSSPLIDTLLCRLMSMWMNGIATATRSTRTWCLTLRTEACGLSARMSLGSEWRLWSSRVTPTLSQANSILSSSRGLANHPRYSLASFWLLQVSPATAEVHADVCVDRYYNISGDAVTSTLLCHAGHLDRYLSGSPVKPKHLHQTSQLVNGH